MAADGSVVIDTKMDTSGFENASVNIKSAFDGLSAKAKQMGQAIKNAFSFSGKTQGIEQAVDSVKNQSEEILQILSNTEKSAKSKAASIASVYKSQGMSSSDAFKKAWQQIERNSSSGSEKVKKSIKGIGKESKGVGNSLLSNLTFGISSASKKIAALLGGLYLGRKLVEFGKESIELGSDLTEVQNVVDSVFTTMSGKVDEFAKSAASTYGLSETMAKQYAGSFGAMAKSFGFAEDEAYKMSTTLTGLAGDVASFYNISQDEAYTKLKSVFSGETETLKDLGIVMTQSALDAYALANGYGKTTAKMTEQEKVALRYQFVMDQLSTAQGDFAKTSDSWANQSRMAMLQLQSLMATIGQGLINLFTPALKLINTLLAKLATLANAFKSFTELITGNKSSGGSGAGAGIKEAASGADAAADSTNNLADATDKSTQAKNDNAKATKKENKANKEYLSGLDEIRKFTEDQEDEDNNSPSSGTGTNGANAGVPAAANVDYGKLAEGENSIDKMNGFLDALLKKFKELKDLFTEGFWEGLGDYKPILEGLKKDLASIGETLKEIFTDPQVLAAMNRFVNAFAKMLGQIAGSVASIGLTIAANLVGGIEKFLVQNKERIKKYLISMFDIGTEIAQTVGNLSVAIADIFSVFAGDTAQQITANFIGIFAEVGMAVSELALKLGRDIINLIAQPIIENKEKIKEALEGTLEAIEPFTAGLLTAVQTLRDKLNELYDNYLKPLFDSLANGLSEIFGLLLDGYNQYIVPVLQGLGQKFEELMSGPFGEMMDNVIGLLGRIIQLVQLLWENFLVPMFSWIASNIMPILAPIIQLLGETLLNILGLIMDTIGSLAEVLSGLIDFIVGVFTGDWELAWNGVKEIFDGVWNLIKSIISSVWEFIKSVVKSGADFVVASVKAAWSLVSSTTKEKWNAIKGIFSGIIQFIEGVFTGNWEKAWNGVVKIFKNIFNLMPKIIKSPINSVIKGINSMIRGIADGLNALIDSLNGLSFPDWIPGIGGGSINISRISAPQIPYLAKGAVIPPNAPFMAMLGDQKQGTNVEAPLDTIKQAVREVVGNNNGFKGEIRIPIILSGRQIFEAVITEGDLVRSQSGRNPFEMA